ncbi:MAG TPA: aminotransferase class I/II-fold pyridoxal phosphate-dependent enzyme, partial [Candidatus Manganitrophaceae bacterium]|nr:aminotransferase class I/II-fold pyridoxal phosphate-dependent enzyme [Candidatus Manganitrophaceae bacterium]
MLKVSGDIASLIPYPPGKPMEELERELGIQGAIKLASNENPLGPSPKAMAAVRKGLRKIQRYPDGAGYYLKEALAERWKLPASQVMIGNGSNEIIELLVRTFILPGDEAVMADPSFSLYRLAVTAGHGKPVQIPLRDGRHDLARMAKAVTSKTKLIFVCNPNNPTGTIVKRGEVARFLSRLPKRVLAVFDEAYAEYATDPDFPQTAPLLREGASLITLRTFSKIYGL